MAPHWVDGKQTDAVSVSADSTESVFVLSPFVCFSLLNIENQFIHFRFPETLTNDL